MMRTNQSIVKANKITGECRTVSRKVSNQDHFFYLTLIPIVRSEGTGGYL